MRMGTSWTRRLGVGIIGLIAGAAGLISITPAPASAGACGEPNSCGAAPEYPAVVTNLGEVLTAPIPTQMAAAGAAGPDEPFSVIPPGVVAADIYDYSSIAWLTTADGYVVNSRYANQHYGDASKLSLNAPVVAIKSTPTGKGYRLAAADGGVFAYGDARFYGSLGGHNIHGKVVNMATTPTGDGYWLLGSDGGVFTFGAARFYGSAVSMVPSWDRVTAIASTLTGKGYWVVTNFGYVYAFGDAAKPGTAGHWAAKPGNGVIDIRASQNGWFWTLTTRGQVDQYDAGGSYTATMLIPTTGKVIALGAVTQQFGGIPCDPTGCG